MKFNSLAFIGFIVLSCTIYYLAKEESRKKLLLAFSIIFYSFVSFYFLGLIFVSALLIFYLAKMIQQHSNDESKQKKILFCGITILTIILGGFKYFQPFTSFIAQQFSINFGSEVLFSKIILPLGLSYYTFKLISYLIDCYWENIEVEKNFSDLFLYTIFFPQISSGPIQKAKDFLPQLNQNLKFNINNLEEGFSLILWGLFKKLFVADRLALFVDAIFKSPESYSWQHILYACYFYTFQIYADFSGITDIALGSAKIFGINSPQNFNFPLFATNIQEFWRKWHISLTKWMGDYVFIPLRMSLRNWGNIGILISISINMILVGIWHGANLNFLIFGIVHSIFMIISYYTLNFRNSIYEKIKIPYLLRNFIGAVITFHLVSFALVLIRADNLSKTILIFKNLLIFNPISIEAILMPIHLKSGVLVIIIFLLIEKLSKRIFHKNWMFEDSNLVQPTVTDSSFVLGRFFFYSILVFLIIAGGVFEGSTFIYNQF